MALHHERLRNRFAIGGETNGVAARCHLRTVRAATPENHSGKRRRRRVPKIPRQAVDARCAWRASVSNSAATTPAAASPAAGRGRVSRRTTTSASPAGGVRGIGIAAHDPILSVEYVDANHLGGLL